MASRTSTAVGMWALVVSIATGLLSLLRLILTSPDALVGTLWAEDGLFALCVRKAGFGECFADPFAGYLLAMPRMTAPLVAVFPVEQWALVANIVAAACWGVIAGAMFAWLSIDGRSRWLAVTLAVLPVALPITGFEAVNSMGSAYMPLLFLATIVVVVPSPWRYRAGWIVGAAVLALSTLTMPLTILLLPLLVLQFLRNRLTPTALASGVIGLTVGALAQAFVMVGASGERGFALSVERTLLWLDQFTGAVLSVVPGLSFGSTEAFGFFPVRGSLLVPALLLLMLVVGGVMLLISRGVRANACGALLLVGVAYSALPSLTGWSSNRYFVVTVACLLAAGLIALEDRLREGHRARTGRVLAVGAALVVALAWLPVLPASDFRAVPQPDWRDEVSRVRAECVTATADVVRVTFTPNWPMPGTPVSPPTDALVACPVWGGTTSVSEAAPAGQ